MAVTVIAEHDPALYRKMHKAALANFNDMLKLYHITADITKIDVENMGGTFTVKSSTPEGEATVYTIEGYEDQELQSGVADEIANNCADLQFTEVVSAGGELKDFGLDEPRATLTVKFTDDTHAVIRVGSDAAGELGAYIAFGSADTVYLCITDTVPEIHGFTVCKKVFLAVSGN